MNIEYYCEKGCNRITIHKHNGSLVHPEDRKEESLKDYLDLDMITCLACHNTYIIKRDDGKQHKNSTRSIRTSGRSGLEKLGR